jgi:hypothetical protein
MVALLATACANPATEPAASTDGDTAADDGDDGDDTTDTSGEAPGGYEHLARALDGEFDGTTVTIMSQWIAEDGERFEQALTSFEEQTGNKPSMIQAGVYSAVLH